MSDGQALIIGGQNVGERPGNTTNLVRRGNATNYAFRVNNENGSSIYAEASHSPQESVASRNTAVHGWSRNGIGVHAVSNGGVGLVGASAGGEQRIDRRLFNPCYASFLRGARL